MSNIIFSLSTHTAIISLITQIDTIIKYVPSAILIIHLSKNDNFYENNKNFVENLKNKDRVFVNPDNVETFWGDCFYQHYLNYKYLRTLNINYDYFVFDATNTTIIKVGLENHIRAYKSGATSHRCYNIKPSDTVYKNKLPLTVGHWGNKYLHDDFFMEMVNREKFDIYSGWVEGMFFERNLCDEIFNILEFYKCIDYRSKNSRTYPREELYFQTIFFNKLHDEKTSTHHFCSFTNKHDVKRTFDLIPGFYSVKCHKREENDDFRNFLNEVSSVGITDYFKSKRISTLSKNERLFKFDYDITNTSFKFSNKNKFLNNIKLSDNGNLIGTNLDKNERYWKISNDELLFLDENKHVTTTFYAIDDTGKFIGDYCNNPHWHFLEKI